MTTTRDVPTRFIGCDVGKTNIVVFDSHDGRTTTIANNPKQLADFAASLDDSCFVVCEATGGYEAALLGALVDAGRAAHRADARKVKSFIRSFGILGKSDAIDARELSRYGEERHARLPRWQPPPVEREKLRALVEARQDLVAQRVACDNRMKAPGAELTLSYWRNVRDCLAAQIEAIEADTAALVSAQQSLRDDIKAISAQVGIGFTSAVALLALMPELGAIDRRRATSLAGLAPHPDQSGRRDGYRRTKGGRPEVKRVLFMSAMVAARHDPKLRAFHDLLISKGKKPIVALTAVMRRLLVICNAILARRGATTGDGAGSVNRRPAGATVQSLA
jgi:transposase